MSAGAAAVPLGDVRAQPSVVFSVASAAAAFAARRSANLSAS
jgi:hypothetical protein